ncbi:MAG: hypothetical protein NTX61_07320 [Bacteroidetes bacterium]|nr:hypothetical protein [Bacteroidota bacterium]
MRKNVSKTSTKQEILVAYEELVDEIKDQKSPKEKQDQQEKESLFSRVSAQSKDSFIKHVSELKIQLNKQLDEIGDSMLTEIRQLTDIREAIVVGKKDLEELYKIRTESESLMALVQLQEEKKVEFSAEMETQRQAWIKEKEEIEKQGKEQKIIKEKDRKREEEEYAYNLNLKLRKEQDTYEEQKQMMERELAENKASFEKEMKEREQNIIAKESELSEFRDQAARFPQELDKALKQAVKDNSEKLLQQFEIEKKLLSKETETEIKLKDQTIQTLELKVKELENSIKQISQKNETAEKTVKDIAIKAIESTGKVQVFEASSGGRNKKDSDN